MSAVETSLTRLARMMTTDEWLYRDAHYFSVELDVDPSRARNWVPRPLRLVEGAPATVFLAWFPSTCYGSVYHEAGVFLSVEHRKSRALHCPWILVDDDVALILGRELLGYPKKMGAIELVIGAHEVTGQVSRRGASLLRVRGRLKERLVDPPPFLGRPHRNVRAALGLAWPKVIRFSPEESPIEVRAAEAELEVGGSERDPLHELGLGAVRRAFLHRVNLRAAPASIPLPCGAVSPLGFLRHWLLRAH